MSDLSQYEEVIYTQHLNFDLSRDGAQNAVQGVEITLLKRLFDGRNIHYPFESSSVKANLDEWAERVREKLSLVDQMCIEQADTLPPEQFALLKQKRDELALSYESTVRNVETIYERLHEITHLLIQFSSESSSIQSWITEATRTAGDIWAQSADPHRLGEQKLRGKQLQEEVAREEIRLKQIGSLVCKIESEISVMHEAVPNSNLIGMNSDEVRKTLYRVEDDYAELLKQCQDLSAFQNKIGYLGGDVNDYSKKADEWLHQLESRVVDLRSNNPDISIEDKLKIAEILNKQAANEQAQLDDAEQAAIRLLNALEGTLAHADVRERHEKEQHQRRNRHQDLLGEVQRAVNDAHSELALHEGVRDSVLGLSDWAKSWEEKVKLSRSIPLEEESLLELKNEEQIMRSEAETRLALADQLSPEVRKMLIASPSTAQNDNLEDKLKDAKDRLIRANSGFRGYRDNINDALDGVRDLKNKCEVIESHCDALGNQLRNSAPKDASRLSEAESDLSNIGREMMDAEKLANRLLSFPNVIATENVDRRMTEIGSKIDKLAETIQKKKGDQAVIGELEKEFEDKKMLAIEWLNSLDKSISVLPPPALSSQKLSDQRNQCLEIAEKHQNGLPMIDDLEELSFRLAEAEAAPGSRSSSVPRNVMDLRNKSEQLGDVVEKRRDKLSAQTAKVAEYEASRDDLQKWIEAHFDKIANEVPLELSRDGVKSAQNKLEKLSKDTRAEQRKLEDLKVQARELMRGSPEDAGDLAKYQRNLDKQWEDMQNALDEGRDRANTAEKMVDGVAQLDRWLNGKQRMLEAIGAPSTDPAVGRSQQGQVHILKTDAENEKPMLDRVNELASDLLVKSPIHDQELVNEKIDGLNRRWKSLDRDLNAKEEVVDKATKLGVELQQLHKKIKKEVSELEHGVEAASRLPSNEVDRQLAALDALKCRANGLDGLLNELEQIIEKTEDLNIDPNNKTELVEHALKAKTKADEVDKKIDSVKRAALNVREEGDALERHLDDLLASIQDASMEVYNGSPICADMSKIADQSTAFDKVYNNLLSKEGDISLMKIKVQEQLQAHPNAELKTKLDKLNKEWQPLLDATKEKKSTLEKVSDLVKQFRDAEATLTEKIKSDEQDVADAISALSDPATLDKLKLIENGSDKRVSEADALDALAAKIEKVAPGPDARHLKRRAENLGEDSKQFAKKTKAAVHVAQKKNDLRAKWDRLEDEARTFCASREAELDRDADNITRDRLKDKISDVESFWSRAGRELNQLGDELKTKCAPEESEQLDEARFELDGLFDNLIDHMRSIDNRLGEKKEEAERIREQTNRLATRVNSMYSDLNDLEPIGRSNAELTRQRSECADLLNQIEEREKELDDVEKKWTEGLDSGSVTTQQLASNQQHLDDLKKLLGKGKKKLDQRSKKISQTENDLSALNDEAAAVVSELTALLANDALKPQSNLADPKAQSEAIRDLKDRMKPLGERADSVIADCRVLIKTAAPESDTKDLADALSKVSSSWNQLTAAVAEKQSGVEAAAQQMGRYQDAHKGLLNWLEETEELVDNQRAPAADPKVARAQLQSYDVLLKHIEDKQRGVDAFANMIAKLCDMTPSDEEKKDLKDKADEVSSRYGDLLEGAQRRQARLRDAADLSEKLGKELVPFENWLTQADKKLGQLGNVPTESERLEEQLKEQAELEKEIENRKDDVQKLMLLGPQLAALVSVEDASELESQLAAATTKYDALVGRSRDCKDSLGAMVEQIGDFEQDMNSLGIWLDQIEQEMSTLDELPINPEELLEQTNLLSEFVEAVTDRDELVSHVVKVGRTLCKHTTADEALALQSKIEGLRMRYVDVAAYADDKLAQLAKAIPLSERFHDGIEAVMEWVEAVEEDLKIIDTVDMETQQQLIMSIEEDVAQWRPEVDELVAISSQLQQLSGPDRADELHSHTQEMSRRVNHIADQIGRRAERLDLTERQSRAVVDELDFVLEWLGDARDRVMAAPPLAIDPDYLKAQLKNQKLLNEDLAMQKSRLRDATAETRKVARQIGSDGGQDAALLSKCDTAKELGDEVGALCDERTEALEQALALAEQIGASFEDMNEWLDQVENELNHAPAVTTATPPSDLSKQQQHNMEISAVIAAQRPLVERFEKDISALAELVHPDDGACLDQICEQIVGRYHDMRDAVKARGEGIDSILDATEAFGDRLDVFLATLEGAAESLRQPPTVSADPSLLQNIIDENEALLESLRDKENALQAMKDRAKDLMVNAPPGDPAAAEVAAKIQALDQLWQEIGDGAQTRGAFLTDALAKATRFWKELENCHKAIDDLKARLDHVEPVIGHPEEIQKQQNNIVAIGEDVERTVPMLQELKHAGAEISAIIPEEEKTGVDQQLDIVESGWNTITHLFADKQHNLVRAMEDAMAFHDDLAALNEWLTAAEKKLDAMNSPDKLALEDVQSELAKIQEFRADIDEHAVLKEQINQTAQSLTAGAPAHQTTAVRAPIAELNTRWAKLYGDIADKEHKVERALVEMGRLAEAADQLISWIDKSENTLGELEEEGVTNLRQIEIKRCKLAVIENDVQAHSPSIASLNSAAARLLKPDESTSGTADKMNEMNGKWKTLHENMGRIGAKLDAAKSAAEDVGGEMERWLAYVEDVESQLATTKPTGGVPETAQQQLDDFHVLKAEVEQNTPALEGYMRSTEQYLHEHAGDEGSWIGKNQNTLNTKWKRCKVLLADRAKKLSLALDEAVSLDYAMRDTTDWLAKTEEILSTLPSISRLPDPLARQRDDHKKLLEDVFNRKALVSEMQSSGTRMQYYCEKKDAIPIKNGLVSLRHRFEKAHARVNERTKQLEAAQMETDLWLEGLDDLMFWVEEMDSKLADEGPQTTSQEKLREQLDATKELQQELASKRPLYDLTRKRGQSLAEHAPKTERRQIDGKNDELKDRFNQLAGRAKEKLRDAENAVLESGAFEEAISDLEAWIDAELLDAETDTTGNNLFGDIDTVRALLDEDRKRAEERAGKKKGVETVMRKADELLSREVAESEEVKVAKDRLANKWAQIEKAADERARVLRDAEKEASDFDAKAHALLDWLAAEEAKLKKFSGEKDLDKAINGIEGVLEELDAERPRKEGCLEKGRIIQKRLHPRAEQPMKHWTRVVEARWNEVEDRVRERAEALRDEKRKNLEREAAIKELLAFVAQKRDHLQAMSSQPTPDDLTTVGNMQREFEQFEFELTEKQPEVDAAVKGPKGGARNPRAVDLGDQWKQLWLDAMGHKNGLDDVRAVLEEMKRLEGWKWDDWKERYVEWNDHGKARVTDLFRRIDRTATGNVPRQLFIEAIINSKFPTSRLEMEKVADLFDKDGYINAKDFINALRFDNSRKTEPKTEDQKISEEIIRQAKQCACCATYKIEKISDGHYRFGETQIKRMVRILRSTVMVRVGGGWEALDEFLNKHDPCRAKNRLNINMFYNDVRPINAVDTMRAFTKGRHAKQSPGSTTGTPGPIMKIREKTERSMPMFPSPHSSHSKLRSPSDVSLADSRIGRGGHHMGGSSIGGSRGSLMEGSRPPSRQSEASSDERPTRIPSLRGRKGSRYNPPSSLK